MFYIEMGLKMWLKEYITTEPNSFWEIEEGRSR